MRKTLVTLASLAVLTVGLTACGSSSGPTSSRTGPGGAVSSTTGQQPGASAATITIKNFGYQVSGVFSAGEMITIHNGDDVAHTVTSDAGNTFDVNVPAGGSAMFAAPKTPGTYAFHCTYHGNMHGSLVVK